MKKTHVAIIGMGTVGSGVAQLLLDHGDRTARHAGRTLWLEKVVVADIGKPRSVDLPSGLLTDDLNDVLNHPKIELVAQLIGGLEPARTIMLQLLESGKNVVTANKALLAEHGAELFDRARELGRSIAMEGAVAGGIPIVTNIGQCLSANQIQSVSGILNGTSNFIMTVMEDHGIDTAEAIARAQKRGYAEADPTMDVDGTDAAQKLAILAHLCFGARTHWSEIPRVGINVLEPIDLTFAKELGYRIRLLAVAQIVDQRLEMHVSPTLIRNGRPLAAVRGANNAITIVGDAVGRVFYHGLGAGQMPTASAVVADMIDTSVGRSQITFANLELWSNRATAANLRSSRDLPGRYYLRWMIEDQPGAMAAITQILGNHTISISSAIQHESDEELENGVPLVIMTHETTDGAIEDSLLAINNLAAVKSSGIKLRVLES